MQQVQGVGGMVGGATQTEAANQKCVWKPMVQLGGWGVNDVYMERHDLNS